MWHRQHREHPPTPAPALPPLRPRGFLDQWRAQGSSQGDDPSQPPSHPVIVTHKAPPGPSDTTALPFISHQSVVSWMQGTLDGADRQTQGEGAARAHGCRRRAGAAFAGHGECSVPVTARAEHGALHGRDPRAGSPGGAGAPRPGMLKGGAPEPCGAARAPPTPRVGSARGRAAPGLTCCPASSG